LDLHTCFTDSAPDPTRNPALFVSDFQDANKKLGFFAYYLLSMGTFTSVIKEKKALRIKQRKSIQIKIQNNMDPDPGGPKPH
jgi:hypothetical protein